MPEPTLRVAGPDDVPSPALTITEALDAVIAELSPSGNKVEEEARAPGQAYLAAAQMAYPSLSDRLREVNFEAVRRAAAMSGWRIECTLREFAFPQPRRVWFDYPVHRADAWDLLTDAKAAGEEPAWKADRESKEAAQKEKALAMRAETDAAVKACAELCLSVQATRTRIQKHGRLAYKGGVVVAKKERAK